MHLYLFLSVLISFSLGIKIGITPDYYNYDTDSDGSISFSAQITFEDKSIPGDASKMSDAQLSNLAKVAYLEMVDLWNKYLQDDSLCPSTMMAMVSEGSIYFASSIRSSNRDEILTRWANIPGSPADYIKKMNNGFGTHRYGGCCAEPNVLYFYSQQNSDGSDDFKTPPKDDKSPRISIWMRPRNKNPRENAERVEDPCYTTMDGYGCVTLEEEYGFKKVDKSKGTDSTGQDGWRFRTLPNRRNPKECANPRFKKVPKVDRAA